MSTGIGVLAIAALLSIGCGHAPERVGVTGDVVFDDGQPVDQGMIEFAPLASKNAVGAGAVIVQGHYEIPQAKGLRLGQYQVRIYQPEKVTAAVGPPGASRVERPREQIAAKFNSQSELIAEITAVKDYRFDYRVERH